MDADCLIKLTKASLKETLVRTFTIVLPEEVAEESADPGLAGAHPESLVIQSNISAGRLTVIAREAAALEHTEVELGGLGPGERGLLELYAAGLSDYVATDDHRLLRLLRSLGVPRASSASLLVLLSRAGAITDQQALGKLAMLEGIITAEDYKNARHALGGD